MATWLAECLPQPGAHILDAGCGEGRNAAFLAHAVNASVHAIDASAEAAANRDPEWAGLEGVRWEHADLRTVALTPGTYDAVLASSVLHWLHDGDEVTAVVRRLQDATRPGGLHAVVVFNSRRPYPPEDAPRMPTLLAHRWYLNLYAGWTLLRETDDDSTHTHAGQPHPHSHAITRFIARRPGTATGNAKDEGRA